MRIVVVSGGNNPDFDSLVAFAREQAGARISLVCWAPATAQLRRMCEHVLVLGPVKSPPEEGGQATEPAPPTGLSVTRILGAVQWRQRRLGRVARGKMGRAYALLGRDRAVAWRRIRRTAGAMELLAQADLVVALDSAAIRVGWEISRRRPGVGAVWGVAAAGVAARRLALARSAIDVEEGVDQVVDSV